MAENRAKGKVKFVSSENKNFFPTLKANVDRYFEENNLSKHANGQMYLKSFLLISGYVFSFVAIVVFQPSVVLSLALWVVMGLSLAGIGMSVMHDANHGAYSSSPLVNKAMGHMLTILGASTTNWKLQHNILHHTYTNITHMDDDIQEKPILRFSPHARLQWMHKYQLVYFLFLYGIMTLYWVAAKDFVQYNRYRNNRVNTMSPGKARKFLLELIALKIIYVAVMFVIPVAIFKVAFWPFFGGWVLMHFVAGLTLSLTFQLAHTLEETDFPMPDESGKINNQWAIHQLLTTANFSRGNPLITWYVGGLNYQIEHHLFPQICHVHYPAIAAIVRETAAQFNIPYLENPSLALALKSHFRHLKKMGYVDLDEIMA